MNTPNPELMHAYGTDAYFLEKSGAFADVLRLAAPAAWMGLLAHNHEEDARRAAEAQMMNEAMRAAEAERMRPTLQGFYGHGAPPRPPSDDLSDPEGDIQALEHIKTSRIHAFGYSAPQLVARYHAMVEQSRAEAELLAHEAEVRTAEEERMRPMLTGFGKLSSVTALDELGERMGRALAHRELSKEAFLGFGAKPAAPAPAPVWAQEHHQGLRPPPAGPYRTAAPMPTPTPGPMPAPPAPPPSPITSRLDPRFQAAPGHIAGEGISEFKPSAWAKPVTPKMQAKAGVTPTFTPTPGAPAPKMPGVPGLPGPKKPLIGRGTIGKGLAVAGIAGLAYGGYKLINKTKQTAEQPHQGGHAWGQQAPAMYSGVGEYGHPVY